MARVLRMPGVSANLTESVLSEWLVPELGDFAAADAIATVETEKAAVDVEADTAGRMLKTLVPPGAQVGVGDPIAILGEPGEQVADMEALLATLGVAPAGDVVVPERREVPSDPAPTPPVQPTSGRVFSSPLARKLARDAGLTLEEIDGTGPRGRILRRDVDRALAERTSSKEPGTSPEYDEIPHSRIRRATARRLVESTRTVPHFHLRRTLRAQELLALRAQVNAESETRVSVNDLVVKAVAGAHRRVPEMNVTWTEDAVRRYRTADIAIAVTTPDGLVAPVLRDVDSLSLFAVAAAVRDLADRARDGRLRQHELVGGSISVTNLGMFGVDEFAAIINPPHAAILAVGAVREEPVAERGQVRVAPVMTLTLAVDHRPVDGALAAQWFAALLDLVENPARLLM